MVEDELDIDHLSENGRSNGVLFGFIRIVSEKEARAVLNGGGFASNEVFEVFDGRLPPNAYLINTASKYRADYDHRKVLFITPSTISNSPNWLSKQGERTPHMHYRPDYPAVSLHSLNLKQFKRGQVKDLTSLVRQRMLKEDTTHLEYDKLLEVSQRPLINKSGEPLIKQTFTGFSISKILRLFK